MEFRNIDADSPPTARSSTTIEHDDVPEKSEKHAEDAEKLQPELESGEIPRGKKQTSKGKSKSKSKPKYDASLIKALHTTFFWRWWIAGALKLASGAFETVYLTVNCRG